MKSKVKLILLTADYPYGKGETFLENEIHFLSDQFNEVLIISSSSSNHKTRKTPKNVRTQLFRSKNSLKKYLALLDLNFIKEFLRNFFTNPLRNKVAINSWFFASQLAIEVQENIITNTVLYSYWLDDQSLALAILKSRNPDLVIVSRAHRWDIYEEEHLYQYLPFRSFLFDKLDTIYSISVDGVNYLKSKGASRVQLSRLGTIQTQKSIDLQSIEPLHIVSISYLIKRKRIDLLLDAIVLLEKMNCPVKWTHFGDGPEMQSLITKSKNLSDSAVNFKGFVSNSEVLSWMGTNAASCVLVNLSESEGIPVSMMEAMSFGVPCIGTNVGGVSEIITNEYNGILLSPNPSADEVANQILSYLQFNTEKKNRIRKQALATWEDKYDANKNFTIFCKELLSFL